jgi:hypothetical protein
MRPTCQAALPRSRLPAEAARRQLDHIARPRIVQMLQTKRAMRAACELRFNRPPPQPYRRRA